MEEPLQTQSAGMGGPEQTDQDLLLQMEIKEKGENQSCCRLLVGCSVVPFGLWDTIKTQLQPSLRTTIYDAPFEPVEFEVEGEILPEEFPEELIGDEQNASDNSDNDDSVLGGNGDDGHIGWVSLGEIIP